jgi:hypothetical protein
MDLGHREIPFFQDFEQGLAHQAGSAYDRD